MAQASKKADATVSDARQRFLAKSEDHADWARACANEAMLNYIAAGVQPEDIETEMQGLLDHWVQKITKGRDT